MTQIDQIIYEWVRQLPGQHLVVLVNHYSETRDKFRLYELMDRTGPHRAVADLISREIVTGLKDVTLSNYFENRDYIMTIFGGAEAALRLDTSMRKYEDKARKNPGGVHAKTLVYLARLLKIRERFERSLFVKLVRDHEDAHAS